MKKINLLHLLSRVTTSSKDIIKEIDGLRFLAIITVVLFHLRTHLLRNAVFDTDFTGIKSFVFNLLSNGGFGVNVFFGISGFVLAIPFYNQHRLGGRKVAIDRYYIRRLTRIEPPYIITLVIFLFAIVIVEHKSLISLLPNFIASLFYSHFFIFGEWSIINPVTWSLETEVQFYLLAPLFFLIFKIKNQPIRFSVIVLSTILFLLLSFFYSGFYQQYHLYKSLLVYLPYFLTGVLFADIFIVFDLSNSKNKSYIWDFVGLTATIVAFTINSNNSISNSVISIICVLMIFISAFKGRMLNFFYSRKWIYTIGGMCYTIYLIHYAFLVFVMKYTSELHINGGFFLNYFLQVILVLPLLMIISSIFFLLFEKPFMYKDWPARFKQFFNKRKIKISK